MARPERDMSDGVQWNINQVALAILGGSLIIGAAIYLQPTSYDRCSERYLNAAASSSLDEAAKAFGAVKMCSSNWPTN